jgi:hypothetical protein
VPRSALIPKTSSTVFEKARELADFEKFKKATDGLAQRYVAEFVNKGSISCPNPRIQFVSKTTNQVVASYQNVGIEPFPCSTDTSISRATSLHSSTK